MLHKKLQNSQKNLSLWVPPHNPKIGPQAQNQNSTLPWLFGLSTGFQNGMTWPGSTNDHGAAPLQGKELGAGQGLPGEDWAGTLPTQKLFEANLASPEFFFKSLHLFKSYSWFSLSQTHWRTDSQTYTHTNSMQNKSPFYIGAGRNFFYPVISTSDKTEWACFTHLLTRFCLDKWLIETDSFRG